jgi:argininosuccinate synthase
MDANLLHISYEGNALEDPWQEASDDMWTRSVDPRDAPNEPEYIEIEFEKGDPVAINGERLSPAVTLTRLNELGGKHGAALWAPGVNVSSSACMRYACAMRSSSRLPAERK